MDNEDEKSYRSKLAMKRINSLPTLVNSSENHIHSMPPEIAYVVQEKRLESVYTLRRRLSFPCDEKDFAVWKKDNKQKHVL